MWKKVPKEDQSAIEVCRSLLLWQNDLPKQFSSQAEIQRADI